jgi:hypothetical protein
VYKEGPEPSLRMPVIFLSFACEKHEHFDKPAL